MGAWGYDFFENDTALDLLEELPTKNVGGYVNTIISGSKRCDYLDYNQCIQILIIGEIMAALTNKEYLRFPEAFQHRIEKLNFNISEILIVSVIDLIKKLRNQSEIRDLYLDVDKLSLLDEQIVDLLVRLEKLS
ncbi:MAG: DUF4259 domain-containing protein [Anaerolineales bacterium]|nr:DUF4259 domain-containing protein [Anaerolineales bacterium]